MKNKSSMSPLFSNGATWLRADFHLHTQADAEFVYSGEPNYFAESYFKQLEKENIRVAVITNHNKFDLAEFKELRKWAERKHIYLLPGIELSVKDGSKGLHILVVFDDSWLFNPEHKNYIQDFISAAFAGKSGYDRSPYDQNTAIDFEHTCLQLENFQKDYFIVMAHVDESSGLFNELNGRGLSEFLALDCFKKHVYALQKSRKRDHRRNCPNLAMVEGTDSAHAGIEGIGKGNLEQEITQKTYIKLSAFNFPALKFALRSHSERLRTSLPDADRLWVKQLTINPDGPKKIEIPFNAYLNTLVGVRGGGKSSILEIVRFALELPLPEDFSRKDDRQYKETIVNLLLGNGGKVQLELSDAQGNIKYIIEKSVDNSLAELYDSGRNPITDKKPADVLSAAYFGQKDLEHAGQHFNGRFIEEKLLQSELAPLKVATTKAADLVIQTLEKRGKLREDVDTLEDVNEQIKRLTNLQTNYEKHNLKARLELITQYDEEEDFIKEVQDALEQFTEKFSDLLEIALEELAQLLRHIPKVETTLFEANIFPAVQKIKSEFENWENKCEPSEFSTTVLTADFLEAAQVFDQKKKAKHEEFEALKREISDPDINVESFREVERKLRVNLQKQQILQKKQKEYDQLAVELDEQLDNLLECWKREFELVKKVLDDFNATSESINITATFMGDKNAFSDQLKTWVRGSNLKGTHYEGIAKDYVCGIDVFRDLENSESKLYMVLQGGSLLPNFQERLYPVMSEVLTWRTPDRFDFLYKKRSLSEYSLGQRATALTAFILAQQHKDLFLIDQPEDDLDNQTVAQELIKQVISTKQNTQYIFATHNPNIVVLGDSDQVIECQFLDRQFNLNMAAGIDDKAVQSVVINIMEGGEEALKTRTRFYQNANSWKH
jgi:chromosome segregation protein